MTTRSGARCLARTLTHQLMSQLPIAADSNSEHTGKTGAVQSVRLSVSRPIRIELLYLQEHVGTSLAHHTIPLGDSVLPPFHLCHQGSCNPQPIGILELHFLKLRRNPFQRSDPVEASACQRGP